MKIVKVVTYVAVTDQYKTPAVSLQKAINLLMRGEHYDVSRLVEAYEVYASSRVVDMADAPDGDDNAEWEWDRRAEQELDAWILEDLGKTGAEQPERS
jgi:hypothetical protein